MKPAQKRLSPEQYLAREKRSKERHEYVAGEVFAMVGTSLAHNTIAGNLYIALVQSLKKRRCEVFMGEVKLHVAKADAWFYPDVMVTCAKDLDPSQSVLTDAELVIEVLSPGTARFDRDVKLFAYRKLPSLREYVLVSQDKRRVEIFRRGPDVGWLHVVFERDQAVRFESVGVKIPMRRIYEKIEVD